MRGGGVLNIYHVPKTLFPFAFFPPHRGRGDHDARGLVLEGVLEGVRHGREVLLAGRQHQLLVARDRVEGHVQFLDLENIKQECWGSSEPTKTTHAQARNAHKDTQQRLLMVS